jgi:hypothetical protein
MSGLDDEETQRKGYTILIYNVGAFVDGKTDLKTVTQGCWIQAALPFKTCSLHHCFNDEAFRVIVNFSMKFFGEAARARAKMHYGTRRLPPGSLVFRLHCSWVVSSVSYILLFFCILVTRCSCGMLVRANDVRGPRVFSSCNNGRRVKTKESPGMDQDAKEARGR